MRKITSLGKAYELWFKKKEELSSELEEIQNNYSDIYFKLLKKEKEILNHSKYDGNFLDYANGIPLLETNYSVVSGVRGKCKICGLEFVSPDGKCPECNKPKESNLLNIYQSV